MDLFCIFLVIMCMVTLASSRPHSKATFSVMDYGAVGDGNTDDSQAFSKTWEAVCEAASSNPTFQVPRGKTFLLMPTRFQGPCKSSNIHIQIEGNLVAPSNPSSWKGHDQENWLSFANLNGFVVDGNGQIDGQGSDWWKSCPNLKAGCMRPIALAFYSCSNFTVRGLKLINSQRNHITINQCSNAILSSLNISAPETSPNTDGIDISFSENILISNSIIGTGDDCIAVNTGCSFININGIECGPGHGISIGSLGKEGQKATVEEVHVKNCTLKATQNGLRIKSWQGGIGFARKISFEDITLVEADNPIIIDQFYCPDATCKNKTNAVKISDVSYTRVHGTSINADAIHFSCSETVGCSNIELDHIEITLTAAAKEKTFSTCSNAHGKVVDVIPSVDCLLHN